MISTRSMVFQLSRSMTAHLVTTNTGVSVRSIIIHFTFNIVALALVHDVRAGQDLATHHGN